MTQAFLWSVGAIITAIVGCLLTRFFNKMCPTKTVKQIEELHHHFMCNKKNKTFDKKIGHIEVNEGLSYWNRTEDKVKNRNKAIELWHEEEKQGHADAQYILGCLYSTGKQPAGLDEKRGFRFYKKAAEQGHSSAQSALALCYSRGKGVKQSNKKALRWWLKLAKRGDADAQWNVGYIYIIGGKGVRRNIKEAECWYKKSAEQGHSHAQCNLGSIYEHFDFEEMEDIPQAYALYRLSAEAGEPVAQRNLDLLLAKMTPEQKQKGKGDYEEWQLVIKDKKDFDAL